MASRSKSNVVIAMSFGALCSCQSGPAETSCKLIHVTDLPITFSGREIFTVIDINGQSLPAMFDTGSSDNVIAESLARRLGMDVQISASDYVSGIGGETKVGTARSHDVQLGQAHGEALKFTTIADTDNHSDATAVLGMNFLHYFDIDLNLWGGRLGLYKTLGPCDAPYTALQKPLYAVDLTPPPDPNATFDTSDLIADISPAVTVLVNGTKLRAIVDTGASQTTIFRDSARRAGLMSGEKITNGELVGAGPRKVAADLRMSAPLAIGQLTLVNAPVLIADQRHLPGIDMLLGYDFVTRVHLWISHSSQTLIMQYPPSATGDVTAKEVAQ
jgi:predicted aspartyl protease